MDKTKEKAPGPSPSELFLTADAKNVPREIPNRVARMDDLAVYHGGQPAGFMSSNDVMMMGVGADNAIAASYDCPGFKIRDGKIAGPLTEEDRTPLETNQPRNMKEHLQHVSRSYNCAVDGCGAILTQIGPGRFRCSRCAAEYIKNR